MLDLGSFWSVTLGLFTLEQEVRYIANLRLSNQTLSLLCPRFFWCIVVWTWASNSKLGPCFYFYIAAFKVDMIVDMPCHQPHLHLHLQFHPHNRSPSPILLTSTNLRQLFLTFSSRLYHFSLSSPLLPPPNPSNFLLSLFN